MDTVRAADFYGGSNGVQDMPFAASLFRESVRFPLAAAPAPWTIPSHASIFTGLYPWEHHCHNRHSIRLAPEVERLPQLLRPLGYSSACLSSNFLIGPELGFTDGFDYAAWGGWWEAYFRVAGEKTPTHTLDNWHPQEEDAGAARSGPIWRMVKASAPLFHQYPALMDAPSRLVRQIRYPGSQSDGAVSPWIEPALRQWLLAQRNDRPVFAFVNLLEAHEPYFPSSRGRGAREYWRAAAVRQDRLGWLSGEFDPAPTDMSVLLDLYRESIRSIDRRLRGLVQAFEAVGRWDDTLLILTSDHGQAFGEHGLFFHMLRVDDAEIRVPLWLRAPRGRGGGREAVGWASLVDIAPTVLEFAGDPYRKFPSSRSLTGLVDKPREEPVLCAADGIMSDPMLLGLSGERRAEFDRPWVGAYSLDVKVVLDVVNDRVRAFDVQKDPAEGKDLWDPSNPTLGSLAREARSVGRRMSGEHREVTSAELEDRLRSWGYL